MYEYRNIPEVAYLFLLHPTENHTPQGLLTEYFTLSIILLFVKAKLMRSKKVKRKKSDKFQVEKLFIHARRIDEYLPTHSV